MVLKGPAKVCWGHSRQAPCTGVLEGKSQQAVRRGGVLGVCHPILDYKISDRHPAMG